MIIDVHGHYTTAPKALEDWRNRQIAAINERAGWKVFVPCVPGEREWGALRPGAALDAEVGEKRSWTLTRGET